MASSGNFFLWNPLVKGTENVSSGNCKLDMATNNRGALGNFEIPLTGKWYFEGYIKMAANLEGVIGVSDAEVDLQSSRGGKNDGNTEALNFSQYSGSNYYAIKIDGGSEDAAGKIDLGTTDNAVIGVAVNRDDNEIKLYANNTLRFTLTLSATTKYFPWCGVGGGSNSSVFVYLNAGQDSTFGGNKTAGGNADGNGFGDFFYSPPSGHLALCSANLPISADIDPAGDNGEDENPAKQCGVLKNNSTGGDSYTGLGFQPDLVWVKWTGGDQGHGWFDSSRGTSKVLNTNSTAAEATSSGLTSFDSDGYTMGTYYNQSGREYMGWCWRANGGTTASNSNGQTTSTVQANQEAGFSIVEYAGTLTGSGTKTIGHGLSKAPELIIIKNPNKTGRWFIQHTGLTSWNYYISFNTNTGETNASGNGSMSAPTASVFYTNWTEGSNENPYNHIAYCWHSVEGYSKFGKYTANGNADGPFIYTGFKPQIIIIKGLVTGSGWIIKDDTLDGFNPGTGVLEPNQGGGKYTTAGGVCDILSNGFKIKTANAVANSTSYDPYVYMAWGDVPFKYNNTF